MIPYDAATLNRAVCGVALIAGCIDAIAGSGGLLTVPRSCSRASKVAAIATNKAQARAGRRSRRLCLRRAELIDPEDQTPVAAIRGAGQDRRALESLCRARCCGLAPLLLIAITLPQRRNSATKDLDAPVS